MKSIKYIYILFFLSLSIISCEDNFDTTEIENIDISEPEEQAASTITGRITNSDGQTITNASIEISHNNKLHLVDADQNGEYEIKLPMDNSKILLQASASSYERTGIDAQVLDQGAIRSDFTILNSEEINQPGGVSAITTAQLASISGRVLFDNGEPAPDVNVILFNLETLDFISYDVTNDNGEYLIASDPFANLGLAISRTCGDGQLIQQNINLQSVDLDLGDYTSTFNPFESFTLSGLVTDCNTNTPLNSGEVLVTLNHGTNQQKVYLGDIINGEYSIEIPNCSSTSCYDLLIRSRFITNGQIEETCLPITDELIQTDYEVCGDPISNGGEIRLLVGSDSLIFENAYAEFESAGGGYWLIGARSDNPNREVFFLFKDSGSSSIPLDLFQLSENDDVVLQATLPVEGNITVSLTETDPTVIGSISGIGIDKNNGSSVTVSGSFKALK